MVDDLNDTLTKLKNVTHFVLKCGECT